MGVTIYGTILKENGAAGDTGFATFYIPKISSYSSGDLRSDWADNFYSNSSFYRSENTEVNTEHANWWEGIRKLLGITQGGSLNGLKGKEISFFESADVNSKKFGFTMTLIYTDENSSPRFYFGKKENGIGMCIIASYVNESGEGRPLYLCMNPETGAESLDGVLTIEKTLSISAEAAGTMRNLNSVRNMPLCFYSSRSSTANEVYGNLVDTRTQMFGLASLANWWKMITGEYMFSTVRLKLSNAIKGVEYIDISAPVWAQNYSGKKSIRTEFANLLDMDCTAFMYSQYGTDIFYLAGEVNDNTVNIPLTNGVISIYKGGIVASDGTNVEAYIVEISYDGKYYRAAFSTANWKQASYWTLYNNNYNLPLNRGCYLMAPPSMLEVPSAAWGNNVGNPDSNVDWQYPNAPLSFFTELCSDRNINYCQTILEDKGKLPVFVTNYRNTESNNISNIMRSYLSAYATNVNEIDKNWWSGLLSGNFPKGEINIGGGSIGGGNSIPGGGSGSYDDSTDTSTSEGLIPDSSYEVIPNKITQITSDFVLDVGTMYTLLYMTEAGIKKLADVLWTDSFAELIKTKFSSINPSDLIMSIKLVPYFPSMSTNNLQIRNIAGYVLSEDMYINCREANAYTMYDLGNIKIDRYFDNFLDYTNTQIKMFLPFLGDVDLSPSDVMNKTINLKASIDNMTGVVVYKLTDENANIIGIWQTQCCIEIPITSGNYMSKVDDFIHAAMQAGAMTIGDGGELAFSGTVSQTLGNAIDSTPGSSSSSSYQGSPGILGNLQPCLKIISNKSPIPEAYKEINGYPTNVSTELSACSGYTVVSECHLENMGNATADEIEEIESLLKSGVVF